MKTMIHEEGSSDHRYERQEPAPGACQVFVVIACRHVDKQERVTGRRLLVGKCRQQGWIQDERHEDGDMDIPVVTGSQIKYTLQLTTPANQIPDQDEDHGNSSGLPQQM